MSDSKYLTFSIEGEFITNIAREKLFVDKDLGAALRILRSSTMSDQLDSDEQLMLCLHILHGSAQITGNTKDGSYDVDIRDDLDERPTELSSIAALISDMGREIKTLQKENAELQNKMLFLADQMGNFELKSLNQEYEEQTGELLFPNMEAKSHDPFGDMLNSFLEQRRMEKEATENGEEPESDYGWLEPNGTWHPVEWCKHALWAKEWLDEHMPFKDHPEIYWWVDKDGTRHHIYDTDVLVHSLNWVLLHNPYQGLPKMTRSPEKNMTKEQKEFLYDYFTKRKRQEEANALYEES